MASGFYPAASTQQLGSYPGGQSWGVGHYGGPSSWGVGNPSHQLPAGYGGGQYGGSQYGGYGGNSYGTVNGLPQNLNSGSSFSTPSYATPSYGQVTPSAASGGLPQTLNQNSPIAAPPTTAQLVAQYGPSGYGSPAAQMGMMASGGVTPMPAPVRKADSGPSNWDLQRQAAITAWNSNASRNPIAVNPAVVPAATAPVKTKGTPEEWAKAQNLADYWRKYFSGPGLHNDIGVTVPAPDGSILFSTDDLGKNNSGNQSSGSSSNWRFL